MILLLQMFKMFFFLSRDRPLVVVCVGGGETNASGVLGEGGQDQEPGDGSGRWLR